MNNWRWPVIAMLLRLSGRGQVLARYREMKELAGPRAAELPAVRRQRLEALCRHARAATRYWPEVMKRAGLFSAEGDRFRAEAFRELPPLTKDLLRERFDDLVSADRAARRPYEETSGGSTGVPVKFLRDKASWDANVAGTLYLFHLAGKEPGERELKLWGSERDLFTGGIGWRDTVQNFLYNRRLLNSFKMSPATMDRYLATLNEWPAKLLWTYVDSIDQLGRRARATGWRATNPPGAIMTTAGTLYEDVRTEVETVFGAPVLNQYGSREVGALAADCLKREGLHVLAFNQEVEVLRADGTPAADDEVGEIVVTDLTNYSMPLLRFRIGDTGALTSRRCSCGRALPLLSKLTGRVTDHFLRADGTVVHGEYFTHLFYHRTWVGRFKVVQEETDLVRVWIVPTERGNGTEAEAKEAGARLATEPGPAAEQKEIEEKIRLVLGPECRIAWEWVGEIAASASGKYLFTESRVARRGTSASRS